MTGVLPPLTVIANAGSEAVAVPSLTLMMMLLKVPAAVGVPFRRPVELLNVAQVGLFWIVKPSDWPSASFAVGWNE